MHLAEALIEDIQDFKKRNNCDRLVMIWCGSTESFHRPAAVHSNLQTFEEGLRKSDPDIAPSQIYAYAALRLRIPFANGAPNLTTDVPALLDLARENQVPLCGKDFKTGQTYMKTLLAPGFKARMLGVRGWFSTNILGNRDGEVLEDPGSFKTKEETKLSVLDHILQPDFIRSCTRTCITPSALTTILREAIRRKAGTTSISSAGSAIRCRSKSTSCAAIRFWPLRWSSTSCCLWIWRKEPE